jgi:hypothetical protein
MKQGGYPLCLGKMLDSMDPTSCVTASASSREISAANCHRIVHAVTYVQANFLELKAKGQTSAAAVREGSFSTGFAADDDFCLMASSARLILQLAFITNYRYYFKPVHHNLPASDFSISAFTLSISLRKAIFLAFHSSCS